MRILGIRHHGPGSSRHLDQFLESTSPDVLFVELPIDLEKTINRINTENYTPPISFIAHDVKNPSRHLFLPLASFSPEWRAITYARTHNIPIKCIDINTGLFLDLAEERSIEKRQVEPLAIFAKLSGYDDIETWWEHTFEIYDQSDVVFDLILELMREFRSGSIDEIDEETRTREAHMRIIIGKNLSKFSNPVVLCGAYHSAALEDISKERLKIDKEIIKNTKAKTKTNHSIIPWSYPRLASSGGYKSGVSSPAWFDSLYQQDREIHITWLTRAARLLRKRNVPISPAHLIDSSALLQQILLIRERAFPSVDDILDVIKTNMCRGNEEIFLSIKDELLIGDKIGKVDQQGDDHPIYKDFIAHLKKARLSKVMEHHEAQVKQLDLRKTLHQTVSSFFYRLQILEIPFAIKEENNERAQSTFAESWYVEWEDDLKIEIIKAGLYGHTIESAAEEYLNYKVNNLSDITELVSLLLICLKARIGSSQIILDKLYRSALDSSDLFLIMQVCIDLIPLKTIGTVYEFDKKIVDKILEYSFKKVISQLNTIFQDIDHDVALNEKGRFIRFQLAIDRFGDKEIIALWENAVVQLFKLNNAHVLIHGIVTRFMVDKKKIIRSELSNELKKHCSPPYEKIESALWIEGLISGNGYRLLRSEALIKPLDTWLEQLTPNDFMNLLPILRRSFSEMRGKERTALFDAIQNLHVGIFNKKKQTMVEKPIGGDLPDIYKTILSKE